MPAPVLLPAMQPLLPPQRLAGFEPSRTALAALPIESSLYHLSPTAAFQGWAEQ